MVHRWTWLACESIWKRIYTHLKSINTFAVCALVYNVHTVDTGHVMHEYSAHFKHWIRIRNLVTHSKNSGVCRSLILLEVIHIYWMHSLRFKIIHHMILSHFWSNIQFFDFESPNKYQSKKNCMVAWICIHFFLIQETRSSDLHWFFIFFFKSKRKGV